MKQTFNKIENQFRNGRKLHQVENFLNKLNAVFSRLLPGLYSLVYCDNTQYHILREIIGFFIGTFYATTIWYLTVFLSEEVSNSVKILLLTFKLMLISSGMAINYKFRCIMSLAIFRLIFKSAKVMLISYIVVGIINGPVRNIYSNLSELGESIVCQHSQLANFTNMHKTNFNANKNLIKKALVNYKEIKTQKNEIDGLINRLNSELDGQANSNNNSKSSNTNMKKDSYYYEKNLNRCLEIFKSGETKCMDNMKIVSKGFLKKAALLKFCDGDCGTQMSVNESCSFENLDLKNSSPEEKCKERIKTTDFEGVSENSIHLSKLNAEFKRTHDFKIRKRIIINKETKLNREQLFKLKVNVEDLKGKGRILFHHIELAIKFINVLANYSYSLVFIASYKYLSKYLKDITFENFYITQYFKHIDSRRFEANKKFLLPFKKIESTSLAHPFKLTLPSNKGHLAIKFKLFWHVILILALVVILVLEFLVYDFMAILNKLNQISYKYQSFMKYEFRVKGSGILANMIRSILNGVNIDEQKYFEESSEKCLPKIVEFNFLQIYEISLKIILLFGVIFIENYLKRFYRVICAYYYRKVEKKRIIWLYNQMLKKRLRFIEEAKQRIIERKKNDLVKIEYDTINIFSELAKLKKLRKALNFLGFCKIACIMCNGKNKEENCKKCKKCDSFFCSDCFLDIEKKCISCEVHLCDELLKTRVTEESAFLVLNE